MQVPAVGVSRSRSTNCGDRGPLASNRAANESRGLCRSRSGRSRRSTSRCACSARGRTAITSCARCLQSLALHDRLTFEPTRGAVRDRVRPTRSVPTDRTNLVWRAAELVWRAAGRRGAAARRPGHDRQADSDAGRAGRRQQRRRGGAARARALWWHPAIGSNRLRGLAAAPGRRRAVFPGRRHRARRRARRPAVSRWPMRRPPGSCWRGPTSACSTADAYRWFDERMLRRCHRGGRFGAPVSVRTADGGNDLQAPVAARHPAIARLVSGAAAARSGLGGDVRQRIGGASACSTPEQPAERAADRARRRRAAGLW